MAVDERDVQTQDVRGADHPIAPARRPLGGSVLRWITTTDHKVIGNLYLVTSFIFFAFGGLLAMVIRAELYAPGIQVVASAEQYNQYFTMHGTIMLLLFATPLFAGFANAIMPLQIGAPDIGRAPCRERGELGAGAGTVRS